MIINNDFLEMYVLMCRTISKPDRLRILHAIGEESVNVSTLQKELDISMSNLSNHLNDLYRAGFLRKEKQGNFVFYSMVEPKLIEGIENMQSIFKSIINRRGNATY